MLRRFERWFIQFLKRDKEVDSEVQMNAGSLGFFSEDIEVKILAVTLAVLVVKASVL